MIEKLDLTAAFEYGAISIFQDKINEIIEVVNASDKHFHKVHVDHMGTFHSSFPIDAEEEL